MSVRRGMAHPDAACDFAQRDTCGVAAFRHQLEHPVEQGASQVPVVVGGAFSGFSRHVRLDVDMRIHQASTMWTIVNMETATMNQPVTAQQVKTGIGMLHVE